MDRDSIYFQDKIIRYGFVFLLLICGIYLIVAHCMHPYSDPLNWIKRANSMMHGSPVTRRAPIYPAFLIVALKVLGHVYIFLVNFPFIILIVLFTYIMTYKALTIDNKHSYDHYSTIFIKLTAFLGAFILIIVNKNLFLTLLNPLREPLAFSLSLAFIIFLLLYIERAKLWLLFVSGVLLGLSIGTRETGVLFYPLLLLLYLYQIYKDKEFPYIKAALSFSMGHLLGLLPFFYFNLLESGRFWVPSYAAHKFALKESSKSFKDIPIPGMSRKYFFKTGKEILLFFFKKYPLWNWIFYLIGLIISLKRKFFRVVILFILPVLTNLFFYSFYWTKTERYLLVIDIFLVPIMALGLTAVIYQFHQFISRYKRIPIRYTTLCILGLSIIFEVGTFSIAYTKRQDCLQVWHVNEIYSKIKAKLKDNPKFVSHSPEYKQFFKWLFGAEGFSREFIEDVDYVYEDINGKHIPSLDKTLKKKATQLFRGMKKHNLYSIGDVPLLRLWCDFEKVASIEEFPQLKFPSYTKRPLRDKTIYHVTLWKNRYIKRGLRIKDPGVPHLLLINCYRIWDYEKRSFCHLYVNDTLVAKNLKDGFQFIEIDPEITKGKKNVSIYITSDAPLPSSPFMKLVSINKTMEIPLGALSPYWYYPYMSMDLWVIEPFKRDAALLFDKGEIKLPNFATMDREVFAFFRVVEFREEKRFWNDQFIDIETAYQSKRIKLPGRRKAFWANISLGEGRGKFRMEKVKIATTLPSYRAQRKLKKASKIREYTYEKLPEVRIVSYPSVIATGLLRETSIDIGEEGDIPYILQGFYNAKKTSKGITGRWTKENASLKIPLAKQNYVISLTFLDCRPPSCKDMPRFKINDRDVPVEGISVKRVKEFITYTFVVNPGLLKTNSNFLVLKILSKTWTPAKVLGGKDMRRLGHFLTMLQFVPIKDQAK